MNLKRVQRFKKLDHAISIGGLQAVVPVEKPGFVFLFEMDRLMQRAGDIHLRDRFLVDSRQHPVTQIVRLSPEIGERL